MFKQHPKYSVGDVVVVKPSIKGKYKGDTGLYIDSDMWNYCGKIFEIFDVDNRGLYQLLINKNASNSFNKSDGWVWDDSMVELANFSDPFEAFVQGKISEEVFVKLNSR